MMPKRYVLLIQMSRLFFSGLSANDIDSHDRWIKDINEVGNTTVDYPIIGDKDRKIAWVYTVSFLYSRYK